MLLREEVAQLQEEVHLLRQMKDMLSKDLEDSHGGCSADTLSAAELKVQLGEKEQELERAKEALQGPNPNHKANIAGLPEKSPLCCSSASLSLDTSILPEFTQNHCFSNIDGSQWPSNYV